MGGGGEGGGEGLLLKERICSLWEQILSFMSSPNFQKASNTLRNFLQKLSPFEKWQHFFDVSIYLKLKGLLNVFMHTVQTQILMHQGKSFYSEYELTYFCQPIVSSYFLLHT